MSWFPWCCLTNPSFVNTIMQVVIVSMARVHVGNDKWRVWELGKVIKRPWPSQPVLKGLSSQHKNTNINDHNYPRSFFLFLSTLLKNTLDIFFVESGVHCVMGWGGQEAGWTEKGNSIDASFLCSFLKVTYHPNDLPIDLLKTKAKLMFIYSLIYIKVFVHFN